MLLHEHQPVHGFRFPRASRATLLVISQKDDTVRHQAPAALRCHPLVRWNRGRLPTRARTGVWRRSPVVGGHLHLRHVVRVLGIVHPGHGDLCPSAYDQNRGYEYNANSCSQEKTSSLAVENITRYTVGTKECGQPPASDAEWDGPWRRERSYIVRYCSNIRNVLKGRFERQQRSRVWYQGRPCRWLHYRRLMPGYTALVVVVRRGRWHVFAVLVATGGLLVGGEWKR